MKLERGNFNSRVGNFTRSYVGVPVGVPVSVPVNRSYFLTLLALIVQNGDQLAVTPLTLVYDFHPWAKAML